jgi:hypothetical protein
VDKHQEIWYNFGDFLMVMVSRVWVGYISHINVISFDIVLQFGFHVDFVKCIILKDEILSYLFFLEQNGPNCGAHNTRRYIKSICFCFKKVISNLITWIQTFQIKIVDTLDNLFFNFLKKYIKIHEPLKCISICYPCSCCAHQNMPLDLERMHIHA